MIENSNLREIKIKLEHYCSYQERCHKEVVGKLLDLGANSQDIDMVVVHLIEHNFLNEARFASLFALSKFHQKKWGKVRLKNELKIRNIGDFLISKALNEIPTEEYEETFEALSIKTWESILEKNTLKKRKKFCDTLLRKGWESDWVYKKSIALEQLG